MTDKFQSIEELVNSQTTLSQALLFMKEHRYWSETTFDSYQYDVKLFETYLIRQELEPTLDSGQHLSLVNKWIVHQKENGVAYKTIMRRVAALSSLYTFYKDLGVVKTNAFKASSVPGEHSEAHSRALDMSDLKKVYKAVEALKKERLYIDIPIKLLMFTGLRNHAITKLKVQNIKWDEQLLIYDEKVKNSKNKYQLLPLPPKFLTELRTYVDSMKLTNEEPLCYGIKGYPLRNKQLNVLVNKINNYLNWSEEERITPHGFRYTIATLLDERGLPIETVKYLLGHSSIDNVHTYLRKHDRKIQQIKGELTKIEAELEQSLDEKKEPVNLDNYKESSQQNEKKLNEALPFSEAVILQLSKSNPELLEKIILEHYKK
ncbi:site-specific integrase [Priestia aryabhattai]|uniref:tyrosine-type recombinase/integrase n=1 Tax=Priestia aryabhattai TaxID=412384 RepID=UPI003D2E583F